MGALGQERLHLTVPIPGLSDDRAAHAFSESDPAARPGRPCCHHGAVLGVPLPAQRPDGRHEFTARNADDRIVDAPGCLAHVDHVGGDDGGDDAAVGCADDHGLRPLGPFRAGPTARLDTVVRRGIPHGVVLLCGTGGGRPVGLARRCTRQCNGRVDEPLARRTPAPRCGCLSIQQGQECLPEQVPDTPRISPDQLATRPWRRGRDGGPPRLAVHRMLLGADDPAVRARRDEPLVDRARRGGRPPRETGAERWPHPSTRGRVVRLGRRTARQRRVGAPLPPPPPRRARQTDDLLSNAAMPVV